MILHSWATDRTEEPGKSSACEVFFSLLFFSLFFFFFFLPQSTANGRFQRYRYADRPVRGLITRCYTKNSSGRPNRYFCIRRAKKYSRNISSKKDMKKQQNSNPPHLDA
ncbi:hypothetical protein B296_00057900 [Ensete ventricosum]|uniref:Uncharacterized protein n=1 Tax=Ensete ventricosum TaxID=4639 RepID=A0A426XPD0_ENSVE|nr:hypothetical protein B296_00057900 [Ensete ventricosum]